MVQAKLECLYKDAEYMGNDFSIRVFDMQTIRFLQHTFDFLMLPIQQRCSLEPGMPGMQGS